MLIFEVSPAVCSFESSSGMGYGSLIDSGDRTAFELEFLFGLALLLILPALPPKLHILRLLPFPDILDAEAAISPAYSC